MRTIYYWEDCTWVYEDELASVSFKIQQPHAVFEAPDYFTEKDIDNHVLTLLYSYYPNFD